MPSGSRGGGAVGWSGGGREGWHAWESFLGVGGREDENRGTLTRGQKAEEERKQEKALGETTPTNTSELSDLLREKSGVEQSKKVKEPRISLN